LPTSRNFPARRNMEQSMKTVTNVAGLKCYQCARLQNLEPTAILRRFVCRWRIETTFQEVREHLGVETQRQWSDLAILRTTPALLGLYSLVTLWAHGLMCQSRTSVRPHPAAWYNKHQPTFSDAIAAVRRTLWSPPSFSMSRSGSEASKYRSRC
jgi:hypothetical protein